MSRDFIDATWENQPPADYVEIQRSVGDWTCTVELVREISRHEDTVKVAEVNIRPGGAGEWKIVAEKLRSASRTLADAADEVERMANKKVRPNPYSGDDS